jgi:uncharacterized membrane protein
MSDGVRFYSAGPLSVFLIILLIALVIILIPLLILGIIGAAFTRLGFSWIAALAVVLLMLLGSFVNIPVYRIRRDMVRVSQSESTVFDECVPCAPCASGQVWDTTISINFGGAVIPVCVSLYMMYQAILITGTSLFFPVCAGITVVSIITFISTRLVTHAGIQVPLLIPGFTALLAGLLFAGGTGLTAAVTAFVGGVTGVLLGGNIANLYRIKDLEVPEVSFGGAGSFGSLFICCMLPALIA